MPFEVTTDSRSYLWVVIALVWLACSWLMYRQLADTPPYKRTSFYDKTLPRRSIVVLGGLLTVFAAAVVVLVVLVYAALSELYDQTVWFFTKGPGTPFVTSVRERFRQFASNTSVRS